MASCLKGRLVCAILVLLFFQQVNCQVANNKKICQINITMDADSGAVLLAESNMTDNNTQTTNICCEGYLFDKTPQCSNCSATCMTGYCPSSDASADCNCFDNYNVTDQSQCQPDCKDKCKVNEICTSPGTCSCNPQSHTKDPRIGLCVTTACFDHCKYGRCNTEGICYCQEAKNMPFDISCVNGQCDEKGGCKCLENYFMDDSQSGICISQACRDSCQNGSCNSFGNCDCNEGFERGGNYSCQVICPTNIPAMAAHCPDICNNTCSNGECNNEGECNNNDDYSKETTTVKANPYTGYIAYTTVMPCEHECKHGQCMNDNCVCDEGFAKRTDMAMECDPIICPSTGSDENERKEYCKQKCHDNVCANGECSELGKCECKHGYSKANEGDNGGCTPICSNCTSNEVCSYPGICDCKEGFFKVPHDGNCVKKCDNSCKYGRCEGGKCICDNNYEINANNQCVAVCAQKCINGFCSDPNICACNAGYVKDNALKCVPVCKGCEHGKCVAPNKCVCDEEFPEYKGKCLEECHQDGSCRWKKIVGGVARGLIIVMCIAAIAAIGICIYKRKKKVALLPLTNKDVEMSGKLTNNESEDNKKESQSTEATCVSYKRMEEDGASFITEKAVNSEESVKMEETKEDSMALSYSRLQEEKMADDSDEVKQEEEKVADKDDAVKQDEEKVADKDDAEKQEEEKVAEEPDVVQQEEEKENSDQDKLVEVIEPESQVVQEKDADERDVDFNEDDEGFEKVEKEDITQGISQIKNGGGGVPVTEL